MLRLRKKELREYQRQSIQKMESFYKRSPNGKGYLHLATGAGKTFAANYFIMKYCIPSGKRVLWLAPDWNLLSQALKNLRDDFEWGNLSLHNICYISGSKTERSKQISKYIDEIDEIESGVDIHLMYSTLQSFYEISLESAEQPDLIVIDEAHWGKGGKIEKPVLAMAKKFSIPILGLTGTPKHRGDWDIIHSVPFRSLIGKYLASPIFESVSTGVRINATAANAKDAFNKIREATYIDLAKNKSRNNLIVEKYDLKKYGKTIVFAIDIDHAEELTRMFNKRGINANAIHSESENPNDAIVAFRENPAFHVAITVNKLNQGIDVPGVRTLFITRPVTSDILYSQMIGRGARLDEKSGKTEFNIVDFEDNFVDQELRRMIFEPKVEFFGSQANKSVCYSSLTVDMKPTRTVFPDQYQNFVKNSWSEYVLSVKGVETKLPILYAQTFGVELELTVENNGAVCAEQSLWEEKADLIYEFMRECLPKYLLGIKGAWRENDQELDYRRFNLVYDGSCGWEIVSSVLQGKDGFRILDTFLQRFSALCEERAPEIKVNHKTGLHVHFGFRFSDAETKKVVSSLWNLEPMISCLVPPSRLNAYLPATNSYRSKESNIYCRPLRSVISEEVLALIKSKKDLKRALLVKEDGERVIDRYLAINFQNVLDKDGIGTLEVRLHSGSLNREKILPWISMWMGILNELLQERVHFPYCDVTIQKPTLRQFENFEKYWAAFLSTRYSEVIERFLAPRAKEMARVWREKGIIVAPD